MSNIKVRINGRGNAWPVILGQDHPFYNRSNIEDLANASCSIIKSTNNATTTEAIEWDLMIDAGHGAVQYLLKNCNRIPEALFITHPHIDHILGLDWIAQSFYKNFGKPYPVYATVPCWDIVKSSFPHLSQIIVFKELIPYQRKVISEVNGVEVISYPVYHGENAKGASMFLFEIKQETKKINALFTGDVLCPLLRGEDYESLLNVDLLVADSNNRFPYPKSNHWSILAGLNDNISPILNDFINNIDLKSLLLPHLDKQSNTYKKHFDYFLNKEMIISEFKFTINELIKTITPQKIALIHYSGNEDMRYYHEKILNDRELGFWVRNNISDSINSSEIIIPYVSQHINL